MRLCLVSGNRLISSTIFTGKRAKVLQTTTSSPWLSFPRFGRPTIFSSVCSGCPLTSPLQMTPRGRQYSSEQIYSAAVVFPRPGSPIIVAFPPMSAVSKLSNRVAFADSPCTDRSGRLKYSRSLINVYISRILPRCSCTAIKGTYRERGENMVQAWHGRRTLVNPIRDQEPGPPPRGGCQHRRRALHPVSHGGNRAGDRILS